MSANPSPNSHPGAGIGGGEPVPQEPEQPGSSGPSAALEPRATDLHQLFGEDASSTPGPSSSSDHHDLARQNAAPLQAREETVPALLTEVVRAPEVEDGRAASREEPDPAPQPLAPAPALADDTASTSGSLNAMSGFSVPLSIDTDESDNDSSLGDVDRAPSSRSVNSSVYQFVEEFGRTFHKYKEGKYYLPNDEKEQNRLDLQHAIARRLLGGKLGIAPLTDRTHRVLDIGTGTGIWAIDFAEEHPAFEVLGTDLSPIQPDYVPPNCHFEIDDAEDDWVWSYRFDYVHGRYIVPFIRDVPELMKTIYRNLNPGGFLELFEAPMLFHAVDTSLDGTEMKRWNDLMLEGVRRIGRDPLAAIHLKEWMVDAGFVNIVERRYPLPVNPWPKGRDNKILGTLEMTNLLEVAQGITSSVFVKALGWSPEEVEVLLARVRDDLRNRDIHAYIPVVVIYGQKAEH